jgi:hypothetical protein
MLPGGWAGPAQAVRDLGRVTRLGHRCLGRPDAVWLVCWSAIPEFFYIFLSSFFCKNIWSEFFLQNCTSGTVGHSGPTAVPHGGGKARGTVAPLTAVGYVGRGPVCFQKIVFF